MENSHKIKFGDVTSITRQYCDLMDGNGYKLVYKEIPLLDGDSIENFITVFCCKEEDVNKAIEEIELFNGVKKEDYKINDNYCHITTYKKSEEDYYISFDENEECGIHANYNDKFSFIEDFFVRFIRYRNNDLVNDKDDVNEYFLDFKKGFEDIDQKSVNKTRKKTKRRK